MTEDPSRSSLADLDTDKLVALSERWVNEPQKKTNPKTKLDIIRTLESGIRSLIALGYTFEEVSNKLTSELHIAISGETVRKYLQKIDVENKKAAAKAKRDATKAAKALGAPALSVLPSEPAKLSDSHPISAPISQNVTDVTRDDRTVSSRTNSDLKQTTQVESGKPKSIVPKSVPIDDDDDDDYLAQQKILKHYNRY
ncbi:MULTISPECIES: hypothetical protein [Pseudanabaena]|uniref:Uncharacterized protein n=2 Tax=Pseudanabaena TaxID=1152 RepID=L8N3D5_9CYAN|nr:MULTISPECIES: hypothetical protein [Pseudanabaena]ELS34752.1 hypothetical protein Pse7429DRAFT_0381 [Pseudanabaena biceps PCC 7429]MDG3493091.1 hypothetical protein [Pseudanabaena catenata USMAC16]